MRGTVSALVGLALVLVVGLGASASTDPVVDPVPANLGRGVECLELRRALVPVPAGAPAHDRLAALRLFRDAGLQPTIGTLQGSTPAEKRVIVHALRIWRQQIGGVLRDVGGGRDLAAVLDDAAPSLAASAATLSPLLPDFEGNPCALGTTQNGARLTAPIRAALAYEGVLVALVDRSSPARVRAKAPAARARLVEFRRLINRLDAFPQLATGGRAMFAPLSRAIRAAEGGRPTQMAAQVARLGGVQPFLSSALSSRDLGPVPEPSPAPAPGAPSVSVPPTRGLSVEKAFTVLCGAGLVPLPQAVTVGEAPRAGASRRVRIMALGSTPAAGKPASPGAGVVLRFGVFTGTVVVFSGDCR
jgi:hypothetical protein